MRAYHGLIDLTARKYRGFFEREDLAALTAEAFLRAYQTWDAAYWQFEEYVKYSIDETLSKAKKQYSKNHGASLDQPLPSGRGRIVDKISAMSTPMVDRVYLDGLYNRLSNIERTISICYTANLTDQEITARMGISLVELYALKLQIGQKWKQYDPDMVMWNGVHE